jgi:hypothetical protein
VPPPRVGTKISPRAPAGASAASRNSASCGFSPAASAVRRTSGSRVSATQFMLVPEEKIEVAETNISGTTWAKTKGRTRVSRSGSPEATVIQLDDPIEA